MLQLSPQTVLRRDWVNRPAQEFRWVNPLSYQDNEGREWKLNALPCTEAADQEGAAGSYFAWLTVLPVNRSTVESIAQIGGRDRWKVENEGFNRQKNSGLNLEHVSSSHPENWKGYSLLLQRAFVLVQLVERGSLLQRLAREAGRGWVGKLFGSLKNIARRLLDSVRFVCWEESWFVAAGLRLELDSSQGVCGEEAVPRGGSRSRQARTSQAGKATRVRAQAGFRGQRRVRSAAPADRHATHSSFLMSWPPGWQGGGGE